MEAWVVLALALCTLAVVGAGLRRRSVAVRRVQQATDRLVGEMLEDPGPAGPGDSGFPAHPARRFPLRIGLADTLERLETVAARGRAVLDAERLARLRLARTLDALEQGVVVCDATGRVVFRNREAARYDSARHGDALVAAALSQLLAEALAGRPGRRVLDLYGPPPRTVAVSARGFGRGPAAGVVAFVDDVTERRRLDAVRRDFVANISHELRTPIGAVGLLAETLAGEDDPETARRLAARIGAEAERLARLVEDLLELTRIEAAGSPERVPVPLAVVVAGACERVAPAAELRGVAIEVEPGDTDAVVAGDRRQLVTAVHHLLDNAVKYSTGTGDEAGSVEVRWWVEGATVYLAVSDHGPGVPAHEQERIFERFYRVDRARSRDTGGTGLGLAIVRHIAHTHDGEVEVLSREGEGATFTLRLPVAAPGPAAAAPERDRADAREAT